MLTKDPCRDLTPAGNPSTQEALRHVGVRRSATSCPPRRSRPSVSRCHPYPAGDTRRAGRTVLAPSGQAGVLRIPGFFDQAFLDPLALPPMLAVVDRDLGDTAILHLQNGLILPPRCPMPTGRPFNTRFIGDFPATSTATLLRLNVMLALDRFTERNGGTLRRTRHPSATRADRVASTWGRRRCRSNVPRARSSSSTRPSGMRPARFRSDPDRLAINHQLTRSFFKQQIDYVRALGRRPRARAASLGRSSCLAGTRGSSRASTNTIVLPSSGFIAPDRAEHLAGLRIASAACMDLERSG